MNYSDRLRQIEVSFAIGEHLGIQFHEFIIVSFFI